MTAFSTHPSTLLPSPASSSLICLMLIVVTSAMANVAGGGLGGKLQCMPSPETALQSH